MALSTAALILPPWFPPLFYLLLAAVFLWRSTFTGEVFLPARMLEHVAPWAASAHSDPLPPWNPLRWDGIAQFYPWRHFAAETVHTGTLPLWNPYQFCGTPFVANSQSAPLYPGNLLFYLLPTARAFGVETLLHLTLCGWFTYLLLRQLRCSSGAALLGGVVYAFSAWQVAWLQLPTFLATSCWFPLVLRQIHRIGTTETQSGGAQRGAGPRGEKQENDPQMNADYHRLQAQGERDSRQGAETQREKAQGLASTLLLGVAVGMMMLAGHLQIAFYGLLTGTLWAIGLMIVRGREQGWAAAGRILAASVIGLGLGMMLVAPQLLPTLELSRISHRAGQKVDTESFRAYTEYALPVAGLTQLTLPDFFGGDTDPNNSYWGFYIKSAPDGSPLIAIRHNAAETALYVGILPLLLGSLALLRGLKRGTVDRRTLFFGGLALLALLLALGTPVNALFYFGIPGFGQSGSPARSLVLWAFALSGLSAFGLDALRQAVPTRREAGIVAGILAFVFAISLSQVSRAISTAQAISPKLSGFEDPLKVPTLGDAFGRIGEDWVRLSLFALTGIVLFLPFAQKRLRKSRGGLPQQGADGKKLGPFAFLRRPEGWDLRTVGAILLIVLDLFVAGIRTNPTATPEEVYPETAGIQYLRDHTGHERIFPVNKRWNLYKAPPAVLPPNAATVYDLRDVQGYDSLLTGQIKGFANQFARNSQDASPPEVGNMVFFQNPNSPLVPQTSALFALTPPEVRDPAAIPAGSPLTVEDAGMQIYPLTTANAAPIPRATLITTDGGKGTVAWKEDGPTRVTLETEEASAGTLNLNDQFYPGWRVTIDGKAGEITRQVDAPFRAVAVPAGQHEIHFRYEPHAFRVGLYLALLAWGALVGCGVVLVRQAGQQPAVEAEAD